VSKPYDAATKRLIELRPADWVRFLGYPIGPVSLVDADLSTISAAADRLIRVDADPPFLVHNELESGKDTARIPDRLYRYNAEVDYKFGLPVLSSVFVLRRESNNPRLTGTLRRLRPDGTAYLHFEYGVVRLWEMDVEAILNGGVGTLPLAPLANIRQAQLPGIIQRMESRIENEATETEAGDLWTATYILMGLRYPSAINAQLLQGVRRMKESVTYQAILDEGVESGELNEARRMVLLAGQKRLGTASAAVRETVQGIASRQRLEELVQRIFDVETWEDLLKTDE
jgi:hypothetical protein